MRNPNCQLCLRCKHTENICIWGTSSDNSTKQIMIVVDTISPSTNTTSRFTTGQGGKILLDLLNEVGITNDVYVTAAVKCHAPNKPTAKEIKICRRYLQEEIETVNPKLIICLGTQSVSAVFGKQWPLKNMRQRYFDYPEIPTIKVAATFSHNIYFVEPQKYPSLVQDLHWIMQNFNRQDDKFDYEIGIDIDIGESNIRGFDVETTGLLASDQLLTLALANPITKKASGYNVSHKDSEIHHVNSNYFSDGNNILVGHNIKFDIKSLRQMVKCKLWDTSIMHAMINENSQDNDLKSLAAIYTNLGHYEDDLDRGNLANEPFEKVIQYNILDAIVPLKLTEILYPELQRQGLVDIFNFVSEMIPIFVEIENLGIHLDTEKAREIFDTNSAIVTEITNKYYQFNLSASSDDTKKILDALDFPCLVRTKKGKRSTSKDTLAELLSLELTPQQKQFITDILNYRKAQKILDHITEILKYSYEGRARTTYNLAKGFDEEGVNRGTVTGRLSSSKANLQNKPPEVRPIFTKSSDYKYFVTADYSQIELRVAAFLSREPNLINAFNEGKDVHTSILCDIRGADYSEINRIITTKSPENLYKEWNDYRLVIKRVNFGILYKIGTKHLVKVIRQMGLSLSDAIVSKIIDDWYKQNAILIKWIKDTENQIIKDGYYRTIFGRIRHLPGASRKTDMGNRLLRQGINFPIQSAASDICLLGINALYNFFNLCENPNFYSRLLMTVHDEISFETKIEDTAHIAAVVTRLMTERVKEKMLDRFNIDFDIPLEVSITIGDHWSKQ